MKEKPSQLVPHFKKILPGLSLAVAVAVISKWLEPIFPKFGSATIAIFLGIILGNTFFKGKGLAQGTKFAESRLLEISVVLLGTSVTFQTISQLGLSGATFILLQMAGTIIFTYQVGRRLKFNQEMSLMMAGGNAVCGSSAIASIAPVIRAKDTEKGQIITLVNLLGTVMMLVLPMIATSFFQENILSSSALLGGTLQSVGQVVGAGKMVNDSVVEFAMIFKLLRVVLIVAVVILFEKFVNQKQALPVVGQKKINLPWYILGFLALCLFHSVVGFPEILKAGAHDASSWLELTALAAIGLRLDFTVFLKEGPRFLKYILCVGSFQIILALSLIYFFIV
ncbi:YeiH family protein [Enterococcus sp. LJL90]